MTAPITERPILMSGPMVRALLREIDPKTQTRRIVKLPHENPLGSWEPTTVGGPGVRTAKGEPFAARAAVWHTRTGDTIACPYGVPGDQLWVREQFCIGYEHEPGQFTAIPFSGCEKHRRVFYRATDEDKLNEPKRPWKPSIHMPRWACRIVLEITDVRVQRLHDIAPEDAKAEGAPYYVGGHGPVSDTELRIDPGCWHGIEGYRQGFEHLWGEINGWQHEPKARCPWQLNPFVWALTFRRIAP